MTSLRPDRIVAYSSHRHRGSFRKRSGFSVSQVELAVTRQLSDDDIDVIYCGVKRVAFVILKSLPELRMKSVSDGLWRRLILEIAVFHTQKKNPSPGRK